MNARENHRSIGAMHTQTLEEKYVRQRCRAASGPLRQSLAPLCFVVSFLNPLAQRADSAATELASSHGLAGSGSETGSSSAAWA